MRGIAEAWEGLDSSSWTSPYACVDVPRQPFSAGLFTGSPDTEDALGESSARPGSGHHWANPRQRTDVNSLPAWALGSPPRAAPGHPLPSPPSERWFLSLPASANPLSFNVPSWITPVVSALSTGRGAESQDGGGVLSLVLGEESLDWKIPTWKRWELRRNTSLFNVWPLVVKPGFFFPG